MDEQLRLISLAKLHSGVSPSELADEGAVPYAKAIKLMKQLKDACDRNKLVELFGMSQDSLDILLNAVAENKSPILDELGGGELALTAAEALSGELLSEGKDRGEDLSDELRGAASALASRIKVTAAVASNADTMVALAEALCKLQDSFYGSDSGGNGMSLPGSDFESLLRN